jgi:heme exporter protein A
VAAQAPARPSRGREAATGAAVVLDGLTRRFGEREALAGVTLSVAAGQSLIVFGPNGAGKSTLLRVLATLLRPHGGSVRVLGASLPGDAWQVRGRVGLLAHEPLLYRDLSARENLRFHARLHGAPLPRVEELLAQVQMRERADEPLRTLSRGMVQRVAIARTVLHEPELLLLDEPRANLDPSAIELVDPLIGADGRRARVITSHDPARGLAEADVVLGLRGGTPALLRSAGDVTAAEIAELYR